MQPTLPMVPPPTRTGPSRSNIVISSLAKQAVPPSEPEAAATGQQSAIPDAEAHSKGSGERRGQGAQRVAVPPPPKLQLEVEKGEKKDSDSKSARSTKTDEKPRSFKPHSRIG